MNRKKPRRQRKMSKTFCLTTGKVDDFVEYCECNGLDPNVVVEEFIDNITKEKA